MTSRRFRHAAAAESANDEARQQAYRYLTRRATQVTRNCRVMPARFLRQIVILLVLCVLGVGVSARADIARAPIIRLVDESQTYDVVANADILDDPAGNLIIDDVSHSSGFRRGANNTQPPDGGIRWYRFRALNLTNAKGNWYVATSRWCSDADLFLPGSENRFSLHPFGYRVPSIRHPAPGIVPAIKLGSLNGETLYVRLRCDRDMQSLSIQSSELLAREGVYPGFLEVYVGVIFLAVLAAGLAIVARSPAFALAALSGATSIATIPMYFARWFPTIAMPPYWLLEDGGTILFYLSQSAFYDRFLELREQSKWWRRALGCGLAIAIAGTFAIDAFVPLRWFDSPLLPYAQAAIADVFYCTAAAAAFVFARQGNRSAWFVAAGTVIYIFGNGVRATVWAFNLQFFLLRLTFSVSVALDLMLFILGVGDRLRQTSLAQQRALEEKDAAQALLVLKQRDHIADIERHNASFARFVPKEFLRQLEKANVIDVQLGDHVERDMAILFADIRGFTTIAERLSPAETFEFLNDYLARAGPAIRAHGGFIDKYVGDAIVALFPNGPSDALDAAIELQHEVRRFNEDRARGDGEPIAVGVGINYGCLMLGTIGESERYETTVIANSVNVASRLEGLTKVYGVSIITSGSLVAALDNRSAYCLRRLGAVALRGHQRPETAFEVFDSDPHDLLLHKRRTLETFEAALTAYRDADYVRSRQLFTAIVAANPLDRAAAYLRDRSFVMTDAAAASSDA